MAHLTGNGEPDNEIQAGIGDIYIDKSGKGRYKCVFTYKDSVTNKQICQWEKLEWQNPAGSEVISEPDVKTESVPAVDTTASKAKVLNEQQTQNKGIAAPDKDIPIKKYKIII